MATLKLLLFCVINTISICSTYAEYKIKNLPLDFKKFTIISDSEDHTGFYLKVKIADDIHGHGAKVIGITPEEVVIAVNAMWGMRTRMVIDYLNTLFVHDPQGPEIHCISVYKGTFSSRKILELSHCKLTAEVVWNRLVNEYLKAPTKSAMYNGSIELSDDQSY